MENRADSLHIFVSVCKPETPLPRSVKKELVRECDEAALYLYEYYLETLTKDAYSLVDDNHIVGEEIGWSTRRVDNYRSKLTKGGWIRFVHEKHEDSTRFIFVLGKDKVAEYENAVNSFS